MLATILLVAAACTPHQAIQLHFPNEVAKATAIASCETGGTFDPTAVSPTNDHGLFQINATTWNKPGHPDPVADFIGRHWHQRYDPVMNAYFAKLIRQKYGWDQWTCN